MQIKTITTNNTRYEVNGRSFNSQLEAENYLSAELERQFIKNTYDALKFEVHEDHYKLLKRMYIGWEDCEFGAPAVDCKRPYGNSSVYPDIAEILDIPLGREDDEWYTDEQIRYMDRRHLEMRNYLQILCNFGEIPSGVYSRDATYSPWVKC